MEIGGEAGGGRAGEGGGGGAGGGGGGGGGGTKRSVRMYCTVEMLAGQTRLLLLTVDCRDILHRAAGVRAGALTP